MNDDAALVLFSGGQDSTTCLAWALDRYERVFTLGFNYGQRHVVELAQREPIMDALRERFPAWGERLVGDAVIALDLLAEITRSALFGDAPARTDGLPATYVPGRNVFFLSTAAVMAERLGIHTIVGGMCETDFSGYPDCRSDFIAAMQRALGEGMARKFFIETPLMHLDKAGTWALADALGGTPLVKLIIEQSHTCYAGVRDRRWAWGYGCAACDACKLRLRGWENFVGSFVA